MGIRMDARSLFIFNFSLENGLIVASYANADQNLSVPDFSAIPKICRDMKGEEQIIFSSFLCTPR